MNETPIHLGPAPYPERREDEVATAADAILRALMKADADDWRVRHNRLNNTMMPKVPKAKR